MHRTTTRLLLCAALLLPQTAFAYKLIGPRWPVTKFPIAWELDADGSGDVANAGDRQAAIDAFNAWNAVGGTRASVQAPTSLAAGSQNAGSDSHNKVFWVASNWRYGTYTLGVTTPLYYTTGEVYDADIVFNAQDYTWSVGDARNNPNYCRAGCTDVFSIAAHEMGHFYGLDHPCGEQGTTADCANNAEANAVMFASYPGFPKQVLNSDDIAGIRALYPSPTPGSGVQGSGCTATQDCSQSPTALICATNGNNSICTVGCSGPGATCPANYSCQAKQGGGYACLFASDEPGEICKACASGSDCGNGMCIQLETFSYCSRSCASSGCPAGYVCAGFQNSSETFCYPTSDTCANNCSASNPCPTGLVCQSGTCKYKVPGEGESCAIMDCPAPLECLGTSASDAKCYRPCNASTGTGCTTGYSCQSFGTAGAYCYPVGTKTEGQACADVTECAANLVCVADGATSGGTCHRRCTTPGSSTGCATGQTCYQLNGGGGACFVDETPPGDAPYCDACSLSSDCVDGLTCRSMTGGKACTKKCSSDADCGGKKCVQSGSATWCDCGQTATVVEPDPKKQAGESCASGDCDAGLLCILDPEATCRKECASAADCTTGTKCLAIGAAQVCSPNDPGAKPEAPATPCGCASGGPLEAIGAAGLIAALRRRKGRKSA